MFCVVFDVIAFNDGLRETDDVFDLTAVDVVFGECIDVELASVESGVCKEVVPDLLAVLLRERFIVKRN